MDNKIYIHILFLDERSGHKKLSFLICESLPNGAILVYIN